MLCPGNYYLIPCTRGLHLILGTGLVGVEGCIVLCRRLVVSSTLGVFG